MAVGYFSLSLRCEPQHEAPVRPWLRPPHSVRIDVLIHYLRSQDERWLVELAPWGPDGQVMASCRGPRTEDNRTRLLPLVHDPACALLEQALQGFALLHFGVHAFRPRIFGVPDWQGISALLYEQDEHDTLLMQLQLRVDADGSLRSALGPPVGEPVVQALEQGDADPLHALVRIARARVQSLACR